LLSEWNHVTLVCLLQWSHTVQLSGSSGIQFNYKMIQNGLKVSFNPQISFCKCWNFFISLGLSTSDWWQCQNPHIQCDSWDGQVSGSGPLLPFLQLPFSGVWKSEFKNLFLNNVLCSSLQLFLFFQLWMTEKPQNISEFDRFPTFYKNSLILSSLWKSEFQNHKLVREQHPKGAERHLHVPEN
jgi:hypothetical protein